MADFIKILTNDRKSLFFKQTWLAFDFFENRGPILKNSQSNKHISIIGSMCSTNTRLYLIKFLCYFCILIKFDCPYVYFCHHDPSRESVAVRYHH